MTSKLLDDLDLYSDLLASVGTGDEDRPLTPIECSDYIKQLHEETGESLEKLSTRLGLGKKRKIKTMNEPPDTTQIKLFLKLQNLSRKSAYMLRFGKSSEDKVGFTIGCLVSDLSDKREQDVILQTVLKSMDDEKKITKSDVIKILERKRKSPDTKIEEIIEHVMKIKPVIEKTNMIVLRASPHVLEKLDFLKKQGKIPKDVLTDMANKKFQDNEISSISLKKNNIYITIKDEQFKKIEGLWKSEKSNVTQYFNRMLTEEIANE